MTRIAVNGIELNVEVAGVGRPLLLLHGFTSDAGSWSFLAGRDGLKTIAVDIIGHGRSDAPADPERYRLEAATRDIVGLLDALDVRRAAVLGYSMGGRLALQLALDAPDRVSALVLESASPGIEDEAERDTRVEADRRLAESIERDGLERFVDFWQSIPLFASQASLAPHVLAEQRRRRLGHTPAGLANSLRGMGTGRQAYLTPRLRELDMPVLLIAGELDSKYAALAAEMQALIQEARAVIVPDAGHAVHLERPELFTEIVRDFLALRAEAKAQ